MSLTTEQMKNHLEFLGFKIDSEPLKAKPSEPYYTAVPSGGYRFAFWEGGPDFVRFLCRITVQTKPSDMLNAFVNDANRALALSSLFYDASPDETSIVMSVSAAYTGDYTKEKFGGFIDRFRRDLDGLGRIKNYQAVFFGK
jgi:hypothetical protein